MTRDGCDMLADLAWPLGRAAGADAVSVALDELGMWLKTCGNVRTIIQQTPRSLKLKIISCPFLNKNVRPYTLIPMTSCTSKPKHHKPFLCLYWKQGLVPWGSPKWSFVHMISKLINHHTPLPNKRSSLSFTIHPYQINTLHHLKTNI